MGQTRELTYWTESQARLGADQLQMDSAIELFGKKLDELFTGHHVKWHPYVMHGLLVFACELTLRGRTMKVEVSVSLRQLFHEPVLAKAQILIMPGEVTRKLSQTKWRDAQS